MFKILPCIDSDEMAASRRQELDIQRNVAAELGRSAVEAAVEGQYIYGDGRKVDWSRYVQDASSSKVSIPPGAFLPSHECISYPETRIQVTKQHSELTSGSLKTDCGHLL